jgi:hypothetical protein
MNTDIALRPQTFADYIGQKPLVSQLRILVGAAKSRSEPVAHTLLHGPPGLGKTTLAYLVAHEMNAQAHVVMGPGMETPLDLHRLLLRVNTNDVIFIDEVLTYRRHRGDATTNMGGNVNEITSINFTTNHDPEPFGYGKGATHVFADDVYRQLKRRRRWFRRARASDVRAAIDAVVANMHEMMEASTPGTIVFKKRES